MIVDDVKAESRPLVPESGIEAFLDRLSKDSQFLRPLWLIKSLAKLGSNANSVVPQCIDLHRLSSARSHDAAVYFCIHPRRRQSRRARREQPLRIDADAQVSGV